MKNKRIATIAKRSLGLVALVAVLSATTGCHRLLSHGGHGGHHGHHYSNSHYSSDYHQRSISSVVVRH